MSLETDGFWKAGFWSTTFWAAGFWFEGAVTQAPTLDPGAGGGGRRGRLDISTLSLVSRLKRKRKKPDRKREEPVPVSVTPAYFVDEDVEYIDEELEDEIREVIFQANAEIASLEASKKSDVMKAAIFDRQIERIKRELMRLREEEDIFIIAMMD